jgi:hypothetical protein
VMSSTDCSDHFEVIHVRAGVRYDTRPRAAAREFEAEPPATQRRVAGDERT